MPNRTRLSIIRHAGSLETGVRLTTPSSRDQRIRSPTRLASKVKGPMRHPIHYVGLRFGVAVLAYETALKFDRASIIQGTSAMGDRREQMGTGCEPAPKCILSRDPL
jgi:hypothetical protein